MTRRRIEDRLLNPSPVLAVLAILAFAIDESLYQWLGVKAEGFRGVFDETGHLLTTLLILWAILIPWLKRGQLLPLFLASCLIDLDHVPGQLGSTILTGGGPRPYTHSLATPVALLLIALLWARHRRMFLALMLGVLSHLWRDMAEPVTSKVAIFWPATDQGYHLPQGYYLTSIALFAGIALVRLLTPAAQERRRAVFREESLSSI
jgi:membrane-bound metal-dependent hydrolase YbcI (DUF457 family)